MAPFDAELYLRRLGEQTVLGMTDEQPGFASALNDAATALVAVDAITPDRAREVLADYAAAEAARDARRQFLMARLGARERAVTPTPPPAPRMVALGDECAVAGWRVRLRYLALGPERVDIAVVYTAPTTGPAHHPRGRAGLPAPLWKPIVADHRGTRLTLDFLGGGSDDRWTGMLSADHSLATETPWIELFDRRIELVDGPVEATIEIEPVETIDPAHRHLWRRVALGGRHFSRGALGPGTAALIASGALAADDPAAELAQRVSERVPGAFPHHGRTGPARNVPEPWRSLLRRAGRGDRPVGLVVIAAVTPEFDGHFAAIYCLESGPDGFTVEAAVSPPDIERHLGNLDLGIAAWPGGHATIGATTTSGTGTAPTGTMTRSRPARSRLPRRWTHSPCACRCCRRTARACGDLVPAALGWWCRVTAWWVGIAPAEITVPCAGEQHRVRWEQGRLLACDHGDVDDERTLATLGGTTFECVELVAAWERRRPDLRVLVVGPRGGSDEIQVDPDGPRSGVAPRLVAAAGATACLAASRSPSSRGRPVADRRDDRGSAAHPTPSPTTLPT
jgi:hypothetical protein